MLYLTHYYIGNGPCTFKTSTVYRKSNAALSCLVKKFNNYRTFLLGMFMGEERDQGVPRLLYQRTKLDILYYSCLFKIIYRLEYQLSSIHYCDHELRVKEWPDSLKSSSLSIFYVA